MIVTKFEQIRTIDNIIIFGAGVMGQALKMCLESKPYNKTIRCFIVSDVVNNPESIEGTPVICIKDANEYKDETIIVALNEVNMSGAVEMLHSYGFNKLILLNAADDDWSYIKADFFLNNQNQCYIPFRMLPEGI